MPLSESTGPTGGYGARPANPAKKLIVTSGIPATSKPPKLPTKPPKKKGKR